MIALSWCGETGEEKSTFNTTTIAQEYTGPHYSFGSLDACRYSLVGEPTPTDDHPTAGYFLMSWFIEKKICICTVQERERSEKSMMFLSLLHSSSK